jgi:RNA polymerase sigma factor (sigma-70 family)
MDPGMRWDDRQDLAEGDVVTEAPTVTVVDQVDSATLRSWLVRGVRAARPDRRRTRGRHPGARRLLASDLGWLPSPVGAWQDLVSALHRQTAHTALERLDESDRKLLVLAYWQGRSNAEIAELLQVSARTVGRRLARALEKVESSLGHAGAWMSAILLLLLASASRRTGLDRGLSVRNAGFAAAGTAAVLAVGVLVTGPSPAMPARAAGPSSAAIGVSVQPPLVLSITGPAGVEGHLPAATLLRHPAPAAVTAHAPAVLQPGQFGCGGNPTSAAPPVPVGGQAGHPTGAPVTHPTAGGCGPHS